jgi:hypothetical protein
MLLGILLTKVTLHLRRTRAWHLALSIQLVAELKWPAACEMIFQVWKSNGNAKNMTQHVWVNGQLLKLIPLSCSTISISQTTPSCIGLLPIIICHSNKEENCTRHRPSSDKQHNLVPVCCSPSRNITTSSIASWSWFGGGGGTNEVMAYSSWQCGGFPWMTILPRTGRA